VSDKADASLFEAPLQIMKHKLLGVLTVLSLLGIHSAARANVIWETDYRQASARSRVTGKPLFIDIYTDWCGWCKKLDTDVFPDPRVQKLARSFVMLKLNAEGPDAPYAKAFGETGYPALYFVSSQNRILGNFGGYVDANTFANGMQQALGRDAALKQAQRSRAATSRTPAAAVTQLPTVPAGRLDWRSQPDMRKLARDSNSAGVYLLDDSGVVPLDAKAKKATTRAAKAAPKTRQRKAKRVRR
jgi:thiol-disulfide isomerase/thioredoxin